jgi:hypothetical protein
VKLSIPFHEDVFSFHLIILYFYLFYLGTNKSGAMRRVVTALACVENDNSDSHFFESGTMEGLMKTLCQNNGTLVGVYDEFSTLIDSLDKGTTGSSEKGRYLSLYSAVDWSKKTKTSGNLMIKDPRLNLISYTQPFYGANFARNNLQDGFFQRFLITIPSEVSKWTKRKTYFAL